MDVRLVRPEEYDEAGRVASGAYREFVPPGGGDGWPEYLREIADVRSRAPISRVLVAVADGRVLGCATVELDDPISEGEPPLGPGEARLRMLGVDPASRGRGVGQALLDASIEQARAVGRSRMVLNTTDRMESAVRLYERNGFVRGEDFVFGSGFRMRSYARDI